MRKSHLRSGMPDFKRAGFIAIIAAALFAVSCVTHNIQQAPSGRIQLAQDRSDCVSPQQDVQLGQAAAKQVPQQMPLLPEDSPISQYVRHLGETLAEYAPHEVSWPFSFHVVNSKDINAFALPGGPIYVNLGTIQAADDESQLAGVIAHEMSHVVLRHGTQQACKAQYAQVPLAILGAVLPGGVGGQLARMGLSFGAQSLFLKYSRTAESEADALGAQIMYDAGYDPFSMAEFFQKLEKEGGPGAPQFLSDHPNPGNRVEAVTAEVRKFPRKQYKRNSADFERIKALAAKMKPMDDKQIAEYQRQHAAPAGVEQFNAQAPEAVSQFQVLNHAGFQIAYPANWQVYGDQNSAVAIAPPGAVAPNGIAYGVLIGGFAPRDGDGLPQATAELFRTMQRGNPELQVASNPQPVSINGAQGLAVDLVGPSPIQTQQGPLVEHDKLVTVQRPDGVVLYMVFIAPQQDFQQISGVFQQMLNSFRMT